MKFLNRILVYFGYELVNKSEKTENKYVRPIKCSSCKCFTVHQVGCRFVCSTCDKIY